MERILRDPAQTPIALEHVTNEIRYVERAREQLASYIRDPQPTPETPGLHSPEGREACFKDLTDALALRGAFRTLTIIAPALMSKTVRIELIDSVHDYEQALPLSHDELEWAGVALDGLGGITDLDTFAHLRPDFLIVGGRRDADVSGGDIARRWWSWRRGTDEFAGGVGTNDRATQALHGVAGMLGIEHPPTPTPPEFE